MQCPKCHSDNPDDTIYCGKCAAPLKSAEEISITKTLITPPERLQKGSTVGGRYKIIEELGRGGMGIVYKAEDTKLKRTVALKFLPPELTHIPEVKERFLREAQAAAALDHPNICTVHEVDEAEEKTFISMVYVEGQSLKKKIESGPLELDEALRIATQVAEGLEEAHKKGVVHRDIKSANIMVTEKGQAKIMDFGLARMAGGTLLTKEGMTMGTIAYMSPEQARGEEVDQRTDIWSLGVVLYEMLSGQLPFQGERDQAVVYSILNKKPKPITDLRAEIPMSIEQVVSKALEKNPDKRYQHMEALLDDLRSISEGIVPEEIRARVRKARLLRRKRLILYAGGAGLTIIMAVVALSLFTRRAEAIDSIAVLPLANLSGDPRQEYFADGMTEELITNLAKISALKVISRTSMMQYKGSKKPLPQIAKELNVDAVIEGSVLREAGQVRITAQLIQASSEQNLWAESYQRDLRGVLALQGEIASTIADKVRAAVTPTERARLASARPVNPETYEAYLKAMFYLYKKTPEGYAKGLALLQEAIDKNPTDPLPYAGLALAYPILYHGPGGTVPPNEGFPCAREAALKALELDDNLAQAHLALAAIKMYHDWDWPGGEREFKRAIELNPNLPEAHSHYGWYLGLFGRKDEALAEAKRAAELDPLTPLYTGWLGWKYLGRDDLDKAKVEAEKALEIDPNLPDALFVLGEVHRRREKWPEAIAVHQKLAGVNPDWRYALAKDFAFSGRKDDALKLVASMEHQDYPRFSLFLYQIQTILGNRQEALRALDAAFEYRHIWLPWTMRDDPYWRSDPRWQEYRRRLNFPQG